MSDFELFQNMLENSKRDPNQGMVARFYDRAVKTDRVNKDGFPIFEDVCFVEIRIKDSYDVFDQPATEEKKKRFPLEYQRYLLAKSQEAEGTPLCQFAFLTAAEIETLNCHGIFTVEALAALSDEQAAALELERERNLAVKFMKQAADNKPLAEFQQKEEEFALALAQKDAEIEKLKAEIATLKKQSAAKNK